MLQAGHEVIIFDNFCNSSQEAVSRIQRIAGKSVSLVKGDIHNRDQLESVLREFKCEAVIHFSGPKAVGESVAKPLAYYDNNVVGAVRLLEAMETVGIGTIVFSSSATVYGEPKYLPYDEHHPLCATSPYGRTKIMVEDILRDYQLAHPSPKVALLRYFNPVGAHESGLLGENPNGIPNNLMPFVAQVAIGKRERLNIWGGDYDTPDGTGVRDYIHVVDLTEGHVAALTEPQYLALNLGSGVGHSVLDVVKAYEKASGRSIPYTIAPRRPGGLPSYYANPAAAEATLGWKTRRDLETMCADSWRWQQMNPNGFSS